MIQASIIITAYNAAAFIERSIQSALAQQFPKDEFEIVVVDDGSTDDTVKVLGRFGDSIRIVRQDNQGFLKAANRGFREAKGKYVTKLDSDDAFEPGLLKETVAILEAHPDIDFVYSDYYERTGEEVKTVITENIFSAVAVGTVYRRDKLATEGFWREGIQFPEYDLILRTWDRWKGYRIAKPLFSYIRRPESVSKKTGWQEKARAELLSRHPTHEKEVALIREY